MEKVVAVILMAGLSLRFGDKTNKQLCLLNGKPIFSYSIDELSKHKSISKLILVVNSKNENSIKKYAKSLGIPADFVLGGKTRQESVEHALANINKENFDIVLIHDGARPLIEKEQIDSVIKAAKQYGAATTCIKTIDTIAAVNDDNCIKNFIDRESAVQIQTPQCFKLDVLKRAHENAKNLEATDDCSLVLANNEKVKLVEGSKKLHKVTTKEDLFILESLL